MRHVACLLALFAGCAPLHEVSIETPYAQPPPDAPAQERAPSRPAYARIQPRAYEPPPPRTMEEPAQPPPATSAPPPSQSESPVARIDSPPRRDEVVAERRERPGLGTSWGEDRLSPVHEVAFRRASASPFASGSLHYNDRGGVDAMASYDVRMAARLDAPVPIHGGITFAVVDESGLPLEALSLGGRIYVVGENGRRYSIVVTNLTDRRYEAVISVDGLDVLDGKSASVRKRGYLIAPYASVTIDGFRKSYDEVAAFRFGSVGGSYAARSGAGDRNVGVIGYAFFAEKGSTPWSDDELALRRSADPFSGDHFATSPDGE
jgi:hypothetical protein